MVIPPFIYNAIDIDLIGKKVLEIGCSDENILNSKLSDRIMKADYTGIDMMNKCKVLSVIKADIINYELTEKYDTILMIEVLEHIHLRNWEPLLKKLKNALTTGGNLIVSVPAKQKMNRYLQYWNTNYWEIHTIFNIDKKILRFFFPEKTVKIKFVRLVIFNQDNKSILWAVGRFIKRILINRWFYLFRDHYLIVYNAISE